VEAEEPATPRGEGGLPRCREEEAAVARIRIMRRLIPCKRIRGDCSALIRLAVTYILDNYRVESLGYKETK
jgi:hypothetical protein